MKIKCIRTAIQKTDRTVINGDIGNYISINDIFFVFGIRFLKGTSYAYIFDNDHLFEVPMELFEIIDDKVLDEWKVRIWSVDEITFWPALFYMDRFLENFAERNDEERIIFKDFCEILTVCDNI